MSTDRMRERLDELQQALDSGDPEAVDKATREAAAQVTKERRNALSELVLLQEEQDDGCCDEEGRHAAADQALCDLLRALGFDDVVDAFEMLVESMNTDRPQSDGSL